jgi:hypothetical protein
MESEKAQSVLRPGPESCFLMQKRILKLNTMCSQKLSLLPQVEKGES